MSITTFLLIAISVAIAFCFFFVRIWEEVGLLYIVGLIMCVAVLTSLFFVAQEN